MYNEKKIVEEFARIIHEALDAHARGEYYDNAARVEVEPGKPLWKILIVWRPEEEVPSIRIKQRVIYG